MVRGCADHGESSVAYRGCMRAARLFVCDVRPFDRLALRALLASEDLPVIRATAGLGELLSDVRADDAPVILVGSRIIRDGGAGAFDALHEANPRAWVILVGVDEACLPRRAREAHADDYLHRDGDLAARLRQALAT